MNCLVLLEEEKKKETKKSDKNKNGNDGLIHMLRLLYEVAKLLPENDKYDRPRHG